MFRPCCLHLSRARGSIEASPGCKNLHTLRGFLSNIWRGNWYLGEDEKHPVYKPASHLPLQALSFCMLHFSPDGYPEQTLSHPASGPLLWWSFHLVSPSHPFCTYQNLSYNQGLAPSNIFFITTFLISLNLCSLLHFQIPLKVL